MKQFVAFTKKEFMETLRSYKLLIMACVYAFLGFLNPLTAKYTPDLMEKFLPNNMNLAMPSPTAIDSWIQFYKNTPQMGLIVLVIVFSGIMANEYSKGTFVNLITKGLKRRTIILSKFTSMASIWTISYLLSFAITFAYTNYFWNDKTPNLIFSVFCLWLFGIMLLSSLMFSGVLLKNNYQAMLFVAVTVGVLMVLNFPDKLKKFSPMLLCISNVELLTKAKSTEDFVASIIVTIIITIVFLISSILLFNKKKI